MNKRYITLFHGTASLVYLWGVLSALVAQPVLTEQDVVKQAVENNLGVEALKLEKQRSMVESHSAQGQWLPQLSVQIGQDFTPLDSSSGYYGNSPSTLLGDSIRGESETSMRTGLQLEAAQALPGGGRLSAGVDVSRSKSFGKDNLLGDDSEMLAPGYDEDRLDYQNSWSLELRQPLLRDAWGNDPVKHSIHIRRLDHQRLTLDQKRQIIGIISESRGKYWDVFEKKALIELYEKQRTYARQRLAADRARLSIGRATPLDTLNAALASLKAQTEILRLAGEISLARNQLANMLGRDTLSDSIHTADSIDLYTFSSDRLLDQVLDFDPQLQMFSIMHERIVREQRRARNQLLPQLDFSASYHRNGYDTGFMGNDRSFDHNLVLSLIAQYSLPTRDRKNDIRINDLQREQNRLQIQQRRDQIKLQIDELRIAWEQELRTLDILEKTKEVARKQLEASQAGYRLGTVDRLSLVDAENAHLSASIDLLRSRLTMKRTQIIIDEVTGTVLPTFGVVLR